MPDHKVKISISREPRRWWRTWIDYPDPTRDALFTLVCRRRRDCVLVFVDEVTHGTNA
jgi:hypothetical protein